MKPLLIVAVVVLLLSVAATSLIQATDISSPKIKTIDSQIDFGYIPIGFNFIHYYKITNVGHGNLIINKLVPNCDCTTAFPSDTLIKPGDTADIKIVFGTENYFGPNTRHVSVYSNDLEDSVVLLEYTSYIGAYPDSLKVHPRSLFFLPGHTSKEISLANFSAEKVAFNIILEKDSLFTVDVPEGRISQSKPFQLTISPKPDLPTGTHETNLTIEYETERKEKISIPIKIVKY